MTSLQGSTTLATSSTPPEETPSATVPTPAASPAAATPHPPSPVVHPSRPAIAGRQSSFYPIVDALEREDSAAPLFMGFDLNAASLRCSVLSEHLLLVKEEVVYFDELQYRTHAGPAGSPVLLWIAALDELLERLSSMGDMPFDRVRAIGRAGQQSPVYWSHEADDILSKLDPSFNLHDQLAGGAFSSPNSPNWPDMTATPQALALEHSVGGPAALSRLTGRRGLSHSPSAQILKARQEDSTLLPATGHISLASSLLCSILTSKIQGLCESDAASTGLWDVEGRKWDAKLCEAAGGKEGVLQDLLGPVDLDGSRVVGCVSEWLLGRYGFDRECVVCPFTGDSAAAFLSFAMKPRDITVQTGESDNILVAMDSYRTHEDVQVFPHPAQSPDEPRSYFGLLSIKNGFSARAWAAHQYSASSFDTFAEQTSSFSSTFSEPETAPTGFYYRDPELHPYGATGVHRFEGLTPCDEFQDPAWNPRALIESQCFALKSITRQLLAPPDVDVKAEASSSSPNPSPPAIRRIYIHGTEAANPSLVSTLSSSLNAPVIAPPALTRRPASHNLTVSSIDSHSPSIGSAMAAYWAWRRNTHGSERSFIETLIGVQGRTRESFALLLKEPETEVAEMYERRLEGWEKLRERVLGELKGGEKA